MRRRCLRRRESKSNLTQRRRGRRGMKKRQQLKGKVKEKPPRRFNVEESGAFGMWKDRPEMKDPSEYIRKLRGRST